MKILIDLQGAQGLSRHRGIGRYTRELTKAFLRQAQHHEVHVTLNAAMDEDGTDRLIAEFRDHLPRKHMHYLRLPFGTAEARPGKSWLRHATARVMREALAHVCPDAIWHTSVFEGAVEDAAVPDMPPPGVVTAATLYDLIPLHDQATYLPDEATRRWYASRLAYLRKADMLLAISEWARKDAVKRLEIPESRITTIGAGVDRGFSRRTYAPAARNEAYSRLGLSRPSVFYTGGLDERKNVDTLIRAYAALPNSLRERHQLVVAGKGEAEQQNLRAVARRVGLHPDELVLPGYLSEADLVFLYNECRLFVFPSKLEGFGLPALEAMACGAPVICSNAASLPEVAGREDMLFDPGSPEQLRERMAAVLCNPHRAEELAAYGQQRAGAFNWDAVAERALESFERRHPDMMASRATRALIASPSAGQGGADDALIAELGRLEGRASRDDVAQVAFAVSTCRHEGEPQWLVDVTAIARQDLGTGVQQVVRNIMREWLASPPFGVRIEPVVFRGGHYRYALEFAQRIGASVPPVRSDGSIAHAGPRDTFIGLDWTPEALSAARMRLEDWRRGGTRCCFVIYDLLPLSMPAHFHEHSRNLFERWLRGVAHLSDRVACISSCTAQEFSRWLEVADVSHQFGKRPAVFQFPLGVDERAEADPAALRPSLQAAVDARPTLLMVGTLEPRKGHANGIDLCDRLWRSSIDVNLIIVGKRGWLVEDLIARLDRHPERGARLFWHQDVKDDELHSLYSRSTALLALSHAEGYGLPLIEAARHGLPVFARDIAVFREVAGDYPFYLGPDCNEWSECLADWLSTRYKPAAAPRWATWNVSAARLAELINAAD